MTVVFELFYKVQFGQQQFTLDSLLSTAHQLHRGAEPESSEVYGDN
jgi:hypothetical protein